MVRCHKGWPAKEYLLTETAIWYLVLNKSIYCVCLLSKALRLIFTMFQMYILDNICISDCVLHIKYSFNSHHHRRGSYCYFVHFMYEKTKMQRVLAICSSHIGQSCRLGIPTPEFIFQSLGSSAEYSIPASVRPLAQCRTNGHLRQAEKKKRFAGSR